MHAPSDGEAAHRSRSPSDHCMTARIAANRLTGASPVAALPGPCTSSRTRETYGSGGCPGTAGCGYAQALSVRGVPCRERWRQCWVGAIGADGRPASGLGRTPALGRLRNFSVLPWMSAIAAQRTFAATSQMPTFAGTWARVGDPTCRYGLRHPSTNLAGSCTWRRRPW